MKLLQEEIRARSDVRRAMRRIGMTGVLETMAEYCTAQAELFPDGVVRDHYLTLKSVLGSTRDAVSVESNRVDEAVSR